MNALVTVNGFEAEVNSVSFVVAVIVCGPPEAVGTTIVVVNAPFASVKTDPLAVVSKVMVAL